MDGRWHRHQKNEVVLIPANRPVQHRSTTEVSLGWVHFRIVSPRFDHRLSKVTRPLVLGFEEHDILPWRDLKRILAEPESCEGLRLQHQITHWALKALESWSSPREEEGVDPKLFQVKSYIAEHHLQRPSLKELAEHIQWSPGHLQKRYQAFLASLPAKRWSVGS